MYDGIFWRIWLSYLTRKGNNEISFLLLTVHVVQSTTRNMEPFGTETHIQFSFTMLITVLGASRCQQCEM